MLIKNGKKFRVETVLKILRKTQKFRYFASKKNDYDIYHPCILLNKVKFWKKKDYY